MRIPGSIKVTLTVAAVSVLIYGGFRAFGDARLSGFKPTPVKPASVNLLAMDSRGRYRILIQNQVAVLAEAPKGFGRQDEGSDSGDSEGGAAKRLPMRELLGSLQGDPKSLGVLVMSLNDLKDENIAPDAVEWKGEDIQKAIAGDAALKSKLESDLHSSLSGMPASDLRLKVLLRGIVLNIPVEVKVPIEGKIETIQARIREPFVSRVGARMEKQLSDKFNPTPQSLVGWYRDIAQPILEGKEEPENIVSALQSKMSPDRLSSLASPVETLLAGASVLMNETMIKGASSRSYEGPHHNTLTDLTVRLTEDGKMRLWKYSHDKPGFQLLLIVDGVAIAAPKIASELIQDEVTITQLPNQDLAEDAVKRMNELAAKGN